MALFSKTFRAMGCQIEVWLETDSDGDAPLAAVPDTVEQLEAVLSRFRPRSELSRLNTQLGEWVTVSDVLLANIAAAKQGARLTNGLYTPLLLDALEAAGYDRSFDQLSPSPAAPQRSLAVADWQAIQIDMQSKKVRLPGRIDLGGVAKGWTADYLADNLSEYGPCLVDMGGDIAVRGVPQGTAGWEVGVADANRSPHDVSALLLTDSSIVTSGTDFRRWEQGGQFQHHIIDPRSGRPALTDVVTATIIHPHAPTAEVYAKAVLLLGSEAGLSWLNRQWNAAGLVIRHDGAVMATSSFERYRIDFDRQDVK
ncbi:MAG: FAD:protein FMN transferase [Anaerolineae bacterium]